MSVRVVQKRDVNVQCPDIDICGQLAKHAVRSDKWTTSTDDEFRLPCGFGLAYTFEYVVFGGFALAWIEKLSKTSYQAQTKKDLYPFSSKFTSSDIDICIRANSPDEGQKFLRRLVMLLNAKIIKCSDMALTIEASYKSIAAYELKIPVKKRKETVKIQIINFLIPFTSNFEQDLQILFDKIDFDCCKWAIYGHNVYATPAAIESLHTRHVFVPRSALSDSTIPRMVKYIRRCYDFTVEGGIPEKTVSSIVDLCDSIPTCGRDNDNGSVSGYCREEEKEEPKELLRKNAISQMFISPPIFPIKTPSVITSWWS